MSIARLKIARLPRTPGRRPRAQSECRYSIRWIGRGALAAALLVPAVAAAQKAPGAAESPAPPVSPEAPSATPGNSATPPATQGVPSTPESNSSNTPSSPVTSPGPIVGPTPQPPAPPAAPAKPSPFVFALHGFVSGGIYLQDAVFQSGQGGAAIYGPNQLTTDKWFLGGDVRQTQLKFTVKGPEVFGGATPQAVVELDLLGGNQITTIPGQTQVVRDAMGNPIGTVGGTALSSPSGDESVLPRLRLAYAELNWGDGTDQLRVGQQHNLLVYTIPASLSHIGIPLGYGAGQLGWRTPGITYLHRFAMPNDKRFDVHVQLNRNSWIDNYPVCTAAQVPPAAGANCLPSGVSMGEASTLPQVEARIVFASGKTPGPWQYYQANDFMIFAIGHWDVKDLSGVGANAATGRDTMTTLIGDLGFKVSLGPAIIAGNGWYGKNSGGVYGNLLQMQPPSAPDVTGFGAWGQLGLMLTKEISVWAFSGIDKPNEDQAIAAGFSRLQNVQAAGQVMYKDGSFGVAFEWLHIWTKSYVPPTMMTAASTSTLEGNQPMATVDYFF